MLDEKLQESLKLKNYDLHLIQNSDNEPHKIWCAKLVKNRYVQHYSFGATPNEAFFKVIKKVK